MVVVLHRVVAEPTATSSSGERGELMNEVVVDLSTTRSPKKFESKADALIGIVADFYPDITLVLENGAEG